MRKALIVLALLALPVMAWAQGRPMLLITDADCLNEACTQEFQWCEQDATNLYRCNTTTGFYVLFAGATEVNDLATDGMQGIADDQIPVGTGAGTGAYKTLPVGALSYATIGNVFTQANLSSLGDVTAKTGTGTTVVMDTAPTILVPTIASFLGAQHDHESAIGGATLADAALITDYSGIGACPANQAATTLNDAAAPTCSEFSALGQSIDFAEMVASMTPTWTGLWTWSAAPFTDVITLVGTGTSSTSPDFIFDPDGVSNQVGLRANQAGALRVFDEPGNVYLTFAATASAGAHHLTLEDGGLVLPLAGALVDGKDLDDGVFTTDTNVVTYAMLQDVAATSRLLGRITAGAGDAEELTPAQVNTLLPVFTSTLNGLAPLSGGGTVNFLRADGNWVAPGGSGDVTGVGPGCSDGDCWTDGDATSGGTMAVWEGTTVDANQLNFLAPADPAGAFNLTWPAETGTIRTSASDDDTPEAGEFGAAADLDANGEVADDSHNHIITNVDPFTIAQLNTQTSDATLCQLDGTNCDATQVELDAQDECSEITGCVVGAITASSTDTLTNKTYDGGGTGNDLSIRSSADCDGLTDGVADEPCYDTTTNTIWVCEPTAGGCDTAGEWIDTGAGGGAGQWTDNGTDLQPSDSPDDWVRLSGATNAPAIGTLDDTSICIDPDGGATLACTIKLSISGDTITIDKSSASLVTYDFTNSGAGDAKLKADQLAANPSSTPTIKQDDLETTGIDDDVEIIAQATDATATSEDTDWTVSVYENGTKTIRITIDGDGGITLGNATNNSLTVTTDSTGDSEVILPGQSIGYGEMQNLKEYSIIAKDTAGSGDALNLDETDIPTEAAPTTGDWIFGWDSAGLMVKYDVGNLPAGSETNTLTSAMGGVADDQVAIGSGAGVGAYKTLPTCTAAGSKLEYAQTGNLLTCDAGAIEAGDVICAGSCISEAEVDDIANLTAGALDALTEIADLCAANEGIFRNGGDSAWICSTGPVGGDSVSIQGVAATDPDFRDEGDIDVIRCTGAGAPDASCVAAEDVIFRYNPTSIDNADVAAGAGILASKLEAKVVVTDEASTWASAGTQTFNDPVDIKPDGTNGVGVSAGGLLQSVGTGVVQADQYTGSGSTTNEVDLGTAEVAGTLAESKVDTAIARLASPALTGDPTVPTASADDNDTSAASTAYVQGEINGAGGNRLTCASGVCTPDAELYTDGKCMYIETPAVEDLDTTYEFQMAAVINRVMCRTDAGTVDLNIENDDGTPADILSAELVCDTGKQTSCASGCDVNTISATEDDVAQYDMINVSISAVSTATRVSVCVGFTRND